MTHKKTIIIAILGIALSYLVFNFTPFPYASIGVLAVIIYYLLKDFFKSKPTLILIALSSTLASCSSVEPNNEGVLMTNYGRNGESDFELVKGRIWTFAPGTELYNVPMFEQKGDCEPLRVYAKDAGEFTIDPSYVYQPKRGSGIKIIFNYKHLNSSSEVFFDNIETNILNTRVLNAYREAAREFKTDSLMNNMNKFEKMVEDKLRLQFDSAHFQFKELSSNLTPPKSMKDAIESRNNAIQQAEQVKNELLVSRMQLEKAQIDKQTNQIKSQGLTKEILTEKYIQMLQNSKNRVIITDGKTPIILN